MPATWRRGRGEERRDAQKGNKERNNRWMKKMKIVEDCVDFMIKLWCPVSVAVPETESDESRDSLYSSPSKQTTM